MIITTSSKELYFKMKIQLGSITEMEESEAKELVSNIEKVINQLIELQDIITQEFIYKPINNNEDEIREVN